MLGYSLHPVILLKCIVETRVISLPNVCLYANYIFVYCKWIHVCQKWKVKATPLCNSSERMITHLFANCQISRHFTEIGKCWGLTKGVMWQCRCWSACHDAKRSLPWWCLLHGSRTKRTSLLSSTVAGPSSLFCYSYLLICCQNQKVLVIRRRGLLLSQREPIDSLQKNL